MTAAAACDSALAMDKPEPEDDLPLDKPGVDDAPLDKPAADDMPAMNSAEYHSLAQKQILNAVFAALAENKMDWATIAPMLESAREVCLGDFQENARIRLHTTRAEGDDWVEAEEAFLGISVADRDGARNGCRRPGGCPTSPPWRRPPAGRGDHRRARADNRQAREPGSRIRRAALPKQSLPKTDRRA